MVALILLVVVAIVVGGGIELARRARFGSGSASKHHQALDTLGHIATQGADRRVVSSPAPAPVLAHVRRVVEADPTHPRISPRPMPRPVVVSALEGSPGAALSDAPARRNEVAVEGVRILLPDAGSPAADSVRPGDDEEPEEGFEDFERPGDQEEPEEGFEDSERPGDYDEPEEGFEDLERPGDYEEPDERFEDFETPGDYEEPAEDETAELLIAGPDPPADPIPTAGPAEADTPRQAAGFDQPAGPRAPRPSRPPSAQPDYAGLAFAHPGVSGGTLELTSPEQTRAQLAALARSGGIGSFDSGTARAHRSARHGGRARPIRHHRRRLPVVGAVVAVLALAGSGAAAVFGLGGTGHRAHVAAPARRKVTVTPTTTTPPPAASLVSKTSSTAIYHVVGAPIISFSGSAPCWIQVRMGDQTGQVVFEGVLSTGQQKNLTGPFWIRLGNPTAITFQVGGTVLAPPSTAAGIPYNLQFQ